MFLIIGSMSVFSQEIQSFNSAEEKIVFNKKSGLDKYLGIDISYTYELKLKSEVPKESLIKLAKHFFEDVIDVQTFEIDQKKYVSILTKGSQKNNNVSREIPTELNEEFKFEKRIYHLSNPK